MAIIHVRRRMVPMTTRIRRVGCKKTVPNRKHSLSLKKELLAQRIEDESQESLISSEFRFQTSYQEIRDGMISDLEKEREEVTSDIDCPAEADFSVKGDDSDLQDMHLQQDTIADAHYSAEGGNSDLQDMSPQNGTSKTNSDKGGHSDLQNMPLHHDTTKNQFLSEGGNSDILDTSLQKRTAGTHVSAKEDNRELGDVPVPHSTAETHFSADGGDSYLQETSHQYGTAMTHFSAEGSESYVPDTYAQYDAAEGSNDVEGSSEGISQVNKWACRVCKSAEVSVAILPCCHLCLCLDCEPETDKCPVCGGPKTQCFYTS